MGWSTIQEGFIPPSPPFPRVPESHIKLLDDFFVITDKIVPDPEASEGLRDVFTTDGVWKTPFATYTGIEQVSKVGTLWEALRKRKSMQHWIYKIYLSDEEIKDTFVFGRIRIEDLDGTVRDVPMCIHCIFGEENGEPRLKFVQGWSSGQ